MDELVYILRKSDVLCCKNTWQKGRNDAGPKLLLMNAGKHLPNLDHAAKADLFVELRIHLTIERKIRKHLMFCFVFKIVTTYSK